VLAARSPASRRDVFPALFSPTKRWIRVEGSTRISPKQRKLLAVRL
jgi:hypothetical protein